MISVVIPVFNRAHFLRDAVNSVIAQTSGDWECVISDNASTDGTYEVACEFAQADARIRVFQNATNVGPVLNWLAGVQEARAEWVKILFSDDAMAPTYIESVSARIRAGTGAVYVKFHDTMHFRSKSCSVVPFLMRACLPGNSVSCSPSAYVLKRASILEALTDRLKTKAPKDLLLTGVGYDFACIFKSCISGAQVELIDELLINYRQHEGNLTASLGGIGKATQLYCVALSEIVSRSSLGISCKILLKGCLLVRRVYYYVRLPRLKG